VTSVTFFTISRSSNNNVLLYPYFCPGFLSSLATVRIFFLRICPSPSAPFYVSCCLLVLFLFLLTPHNSTSPVYFIVTRLRKNLCKRYTDTWRDKCEQWLSSNTTTSKNIKPEYSKMMNPPEIINVNYTPDQEGKEIRQEDVVRPMNRKIMTMKDVAKWEEISRSRAPTYGSCEYCFRSGPLGKRCNCCDNGKYEVILLLVKGGAIAMLDSITVSKIMGQGHKVCLADHKMNWNQTPCRHFNSLCAQLVIDQRYNDVKDEYVRNTLRRTHWSLFLEWKDNWFD
jgi:hypothetical protein